MTMSTGLTQRIFAGRRGGRLTKWKGRVASAAPYMLYATVSVGALSSGIAHAETITTPELGPVILDAAEDHEITATGSVTLASTEGAAVVIDDDYGNTFENNGTVAVTGTATGSGLGVVVAGDLLGTGQIVNNGTISSDRSATTSLFSVGVMIDGVIEGAMQNSGTISTIHEGAGPGSSENVHATGIAAPIVEVGGQIVNDGDIMIDVEGAFDITGWGIVSFVGVAGQIDNTGTMSVEVSATSGTAEGYGIYTGTIAETGVVSNSGSITVNVDATTGGVAYGIDVDGDVAGTISNTGTVDVSVSSTSFASAFGVNVNGELGATGTINNGSLITVEADGSSSVSAYGIHVDGTANGTIINSGTIAVDADGSFSATGTGIYADGVGATGQITNSGSIDVNASASSSAFGFGILVTDPVAGAILNSGTIDLENGFAFETALTGIFAQSVSEGGRIENAATIQIDASASSSADAHGVLVEDGVAGTVLNSGTIEVDAWGTTSAQGAGIQAGSVEATGTVANTGTINVDVSASSQANGYGIEVSGQVAGTVSNSGTITVEVDASESDADAYGIAAGSIAAGAQIVNSGTINVDSSASDSADAYGIHVAGAVDGQLTNSGTIALEADSDRDDAEGVGLYAGSVGATGQVLNAGTITVDLFASSSAFAYGIAIEGNVAGSVTNTGTIELYSEASDEDPFAIGILVEGDLEATGTILNSGTIDATALTTSDSTAYAFGISVEGEMHGAIVNTGTIDLLATAPVTYEAVAVGIELESDMSGSIQNSGSIVATANAVESDASAYGIRIDGDMLEGAEITNSGTIGAIATNDTDDSAEAYGFQLQGLMEAGTSFTNTGVIIADASATDTHATAIGIDISGSVAGEIANSGTISVIASNENSDAEATGLSVGGGLADSGQLLNSGTIMVMAMSASESADATGVLLDGDIAAGALMRNTGTISAVGISGENEGTASGVSIDGNLIGTFENSGTISAYKEAVSYYAVADGIEIDDITSGSFTNSGTVSATAIGLTDATATGVRLGDDVSGAFANTGTISVLAESTEDEVEAVGVEVDGSVTGQLTNSGAVTVTARTASTDEGITAIGLGIDAIAADGTVENSGTISVTASNEGSASYIAASGASIDTLTGSFSNTGTITVAVANNTDVDVNDVYGLYVGTLSGEIINVGTISVTSDDPDADMYAIYIDGGTGTINLDTDDEVNGLISVSEQNVDLFADGSGAVFTFEDRDTAAGVFTAEVANDSLAWFVEDEGGAAPVYASVNAADIDMMGLTVANVGGLLDGLSAGLPVGGGVEASRNTLSYKQDGGGMRPFVSGNLSTTSFEGTDGANDVDTSTLDATFGYGGQTATGLGLSIGGGLFITDGSSGPNSFDSTGYFGGITVGHQAGGFSIEGGVGAGIIATDNSREISGSDNADASIDSVFTTVHAGVSREFALGDTLAMTGFGNVRYTSLNVDGYEESGSSADATVDDYVVDTTEFVLGVEAAYAIGDAGTLTGELTAISRTMGGDDMVDVTVFGSSASLATTASDFAGAGVEFGYETAFGEAGNFNVSLGQEFGDGGAGPTLSAGVSWSF
ncbi:autotransporter domain-containing protein [Cognatiyoonia sp. IB215182]|uniref:beta strand repeat-containing protein n=1 Tax=Cognatiyoonia sp. IB215182 TaxID=3097353 RepID=UPI002A0D676D|nr:autotransporter domain-containing protein [Cognatiyoonia sp. IB215182]MDX8354937.1 autotransporter domain-containing protein [Cognatiyoonia sp. IB215182]